MNRLARLFVALLRTMLGLCALVLVLTALYASLGRQLAPLVAEYRAEVESKAGDALGMPVAIGALQGGWDGLSPLLTVHDLQLGEGSRAIRLDQVRLVPDVLGSLLARAPRIANLQVEGLQLSLRQDGQGHWAVDGLPSREPQKPMDVQQLLLRLPMLKELSLLDSQLTFEPFEQKPLSLTDASFTLLSSGRRLRLDGHVLLPDGQPLALQIKTRIDRQDWRASQTELYLSLPQSDWASLLPAGLTRDWRIEQATLGGEFWLDWSQGQVQRAYARLHAPELRAGYAERKAVQIDDFGLNVYAERREDGFDLQVDSLAFSLGETRWGELRLALKHQNQQEDSAEQWQLSVDRLDLAPLTPLVLALAPLPEQADEVLAALKPQGILHNVQATYLPQRSDPKRLQFSANLERVGISSWHGVPAVENASGSVTGDLAGGELLANSENFGLHLDTLFPDIWRYRQASARLLWQLDDSAFTLRSPYLQVVGDEGRIAGDFLIRLMKDPALEDYMDLRVGIRDGDAKYTSKYLPTLSPGLSPKLSEWLQTAIRGGKVDEGWFEYQGSLHKDADAAARSISLFFRVHDAELAFQPGWPVLHEARGEVLIEDSGVQVRVPQGRLLNSTLEAVSVDIPHADHGQVAHLQLTGEVQSSLGDALKILQDAPIGTAPTFAGWQGEGPLSGKLKLDIPLAHDQAIKPKVQVDFATEGARLQISSPKLELSQLKGAFRFDSSSGLSAPNIRAQVFGRAVQGKAIAGGPRGNAQTRIEANGRVAVKALSDWLGVTRPLPLSGELPYRLNIQLAGSDSQLRVDSDLKGLAIDLPAPFGKAAADSGQASWRMTLQGNERNYWLDYGDLASLAFAAPLGQIMQGRGALRLGGGAASLPSDQGLRVSGRLTELDWSAWQAAASRYQVTQSDPAALQFFRGAQLQIDSFKGFGSDLQQLSVQLARAPQGWSLDLDSALAKGNVLLPDASGAPIAVNLARLSFPPAAPPAKADAPVVEKPDPLAAVDPRQIPALDLRIDKVMQGEQLLGSWSLKARPTPQGVQFSELAMGLKGMQLHGTLGWEGAPGSTRSWFKGRVEGDNLADVLLAWGFAPTATSESFRLNVDGGWLGSPAWLSLKRYSGSLEPRLRKGQFIEVQGSASALRVFGLLNFNSIGRRLRLDFSDLLGRGLSYDTTKAVLVAQDGVFNTREPLKVVGPSSTLELNGTLDMARDQIDAKLLVTLPVSNNLPLAALVVGAPAIGGALFVVDKLLGDKVARFASVQYSVKGDWKDPQISFEKPFEKPR
ncbi:MAG TPA: YhdP family protein [Pseudomonas sp.]|nr:YhdP family protein [Pseudomonas sp.]